MLYWRNYVESGCAIAGFHCINKYFFFHNPLSHAYSGLVSIMSTVDFLNAFKDELDDNDQKKSDEKKQLIRVDIGLLTFYVVCFLLMAIWRNKIISHTYMIKSVILIVKVSLSLASTMIYYDYDLIFVMLEHGLLIYEETIGVLLFFELYRCICVMEARQYQMRWLLLKAFLLLLFAAGWMVLFDFADFSAKTKWLKLREVIWGSVMTLLILFFIVKIIITLVGGWNFRERVRGNNFFILGLMMVTVTSQLTKLSVHTTKFVIELTAEDTKFSCLENLMNNEPGSMSMAEAMLIGMRCEMTRIEHRTPLPFLTTELSCLLECLFCAGVMVYRKFITPGFKKCHGQLSG